MNKKKSGKYVGRRVSRKESLKELGDPTKWEEEARKLEEDFKRKPALGQSPEMARSSMRKVALHGAKMQKSKKTKTIRHVSRIRSQKKGKRKK